MLWFECNIYFRGSLQSTKWVWVEKIQNCKSALAIIRQTKNRNNLWYVLRIIVYYSLALCLCVCMRMKSLCMFA